MINDYGGVNFTQYNLSNSEFNYFQFIKIVGKDVWLFKIYEWTIYLDLMWNKIYTTTSQNFKMFNQLKFLHILSQTAFNQPGAINSKDIRYYK